MVIHSRAASGVSQPGDVRCHFLLVCVARIFRCHLDILASLKVHQYYWLVEVRTDLLRIENMKQHDFISMKAQRCDRTNNLLRGAVEIGNHKNQTTAAQKLLKVTDRLREVGSGAGLGHFKAVQQPADLSLSGGRSNIVPDFVIENDQTRGVALIANREVEQRSGHIARIVDLGDPVGAEVHRIARIQNDREEAVGFAAILLQVHAFRTREHVPVHMTQIVARRIGAVLGELLAKAEIRRAVKARHKAVDDRPRDEIEARNLGEHRRIEKTLQDQAPFGGGTCSISLRRISSVLIPSDSAWKLSKIRCRSTGSASARMSSVATW